MMFSEELFYSLIKKAAYNGVKEALTETTEKETKIEIIGREELCKRLNVTEQTIIRYEKKKLIPRIEIGSSIRYDWNKVLTALERKRA